MSVVFPAPFSPIRACTSPAPTVSSTDRSTGTPKNALLISCIESSGGSVSAALEGATLGTSGLWHAPPRLPRIGSVARERFVTGADRDGRSPCTVMVEKEP
jgi:hypothetical protein